MERSETAFSSPTGAQSDDNSASVDATRAGLIIGCEADRPNRPRERAAIHVPLTLRAPDAETERERGAQFDALAREAQACVRCPRLAERVAVLSRANGSLRPRVVFVAEAPGRRGGDRTGVPMSGDASGRHFHWLLAQAGLSVDDIFITNAVLCNPRKVSGANDKPTRQEADQCAGFLRRQLDLLRPELVVSVGATALEALHRLEPHGLRLASDVGRAVVWRNTCLLPVYHPSPQVVISRRSLAQQAEDWQAILPLLRPEGR